MSKQFGLDRSTIIETGDVLIDFVEVGDKDGFSIVVELRSTCSSENLFNVQNGKVTITSGGVVDVSPFDYHSVGWQVYTPCQSGRRHQKANLAFQK